MTTHFANHTEIVVKVATWSSLKANFAHQSTCSSNGTEQNINTRSAKNLIKICAVIRPSGFRQAPVVSWSAVQTKLHCRAMRKKKNRNYHHYYLSAFWLRLSHYWIVPSRSYPVPTSRLALGIVFHHGNPMEPADGRKVKEMDESDLATGNHFHLPLSTGKV